jgi:phosphonate transport system substrate-binding protein
VFNKQFIFLVALVSALIMTSCTRDRGVPGSEKNPLKFLLVPSVDTKLLESTAKDIKVYLEKNTPYKYEFTVPNSYVAVVEAFGTKRADIASINTFGYIMAHERYKTQAKITFIRHGLETYQSQIIARADSKVKSLEDIDKKKFAYVDPASTSGYLMPAKLFLDANVKPSETVFAKKHDNVVMMVYQKQVDAGATFYSPPSEKNGMEDARRLVLKQYPDVEEKIKIIKLTDPIPNDPIVFRADLPEEVKEAVITALMNYMATDEGKRVFGEIYGITGMVRATDARYDSVREMLQKLGKNAAELSKK